MMHSKKPRARMPHAVVVEAWIFVVAVAVAVYLFQTGTVDALIAWTLDAGALFAGVIAGTFYSTFITTPFAVATLVGLGKTLSLPIWQVAIVGAIGATISDLALARFLRSPLSLYMTEHILNRHGPGLERRIKRSAFMRLGAIALGAFLVAVPIPTDELGIALFDASGLRFIQMLPICFVSNIVAIYAILAFVHATA